MRPYDVQIHAIKRKQRVRSVAHRLLCYQQRQRTRNGRTRLTRSPFASQRKHPDVPRLSRCSCRSVCHGTYGTSVTSVNVIVARKRQRLQRVHATLFGRWNCRARPSVRPLR